MAENSGYKSPDSKKDARIEYLEKLAKWHLFSLELLASLGELHHSASQDRNPDKVFEVAREHLVKILKFDAIAFYRVDEPDSDFLLKFIWPDEKLNTIKTEVDRRINDSSFAWAVNQNRPVVVKSSEQGKHLILHVLSTKQRVRGMFAGLISDVSPQLEETIQYTLSIILQNTANALESVALYNLFQETNSHLENKVRERTSDLEDHMVKMKEEIAYRKLAEESLWVARQVAESVLKNKNDLLTQFSNDLKTPINSILGYGEIIRSEIEKAGQTQLTGNLEIMQSTGRHLLKLIDDIQDLVRYSSHSMDLQLETFQVSNVLEGVSDTLFPLARKNGNEIELKIGDGLGSMVSDESRVRQILLNIAGNACKFTEKGKILIEGLKEEEDEGKWICFKVTDTGSGMDAQQVRNLFHERGPGKSGLVKSGNAGLGLLFSKRLCDILGGSIQVKSKLGEGSVITIRLPRDCESSESGRDEKIKSIESVNFWKNKNVLPESKLKAKSATDHLEHEKDESAENSNRKSIWVVDEDQANSKVLCHILNAQGWSALPREPTNIALADLKDNAPDLMIIGLGVSGGEGLEFISDMDKNKQGKSIPLLIFTAKELTDHEKSMLPNQVQCVLQKGNCTRNQLIERIKDLLKIESLH